MAAEIRSTLDILKRKQVEAKTRVSRSRIYAGISAGTFPKPVRLGPRAVGWISGEIDDWINERIAQRDGAK